MMASVVSSIQLLGIELEHVPGGCTSLLMLDFYWCHMIASVVSSIQLLGIELEHVPGGCTSLRLFMLESICHSRKMFTRIGGLNDGFAD